jgi:hypothetical protein
MRRLAFVTVAAAATLAAAAPATAAVPTIPKPELRAIRLLLKAFVPAAVGRDHPGKAWALATPAMRASATHAQWRQGTLPVVPYPVANTPYGIRPITVEPGDVTFDLMLQPKKGSKTGVLVYTTEVQRVGSRWLVASMAASAQFAGPGAPATIMAQPDYAPHAQGIPQHQNLSGSWVLVPIAVLGLPLIAAPVGILLVRRRGRVARPDRDAHERAAAPWRTS